MSLSVFQCLVGVAGVLAVVALIKPQWPLLAVAVFLIAVALLAKS